MKDGMFSHRWIFKNGALWEKQEMHIVKDYVIKPDNYSQTVCSHCIKAGDGFYLCPLVLIGFNEGGHNSVGFCFYCVFENLMAVTRGDK